MDLGIGSDQAENFQRHLVTTVSAFVYSEFEVKSTGGR